MWYHLHATPAGYSCALGKAGGMHLMNRPVVIAVLALVTLASSACGKTASYEEGFKAGQRLSTLGLDGSAACKGAFIVSAASDREEFLEGCQDGLDS